LTAKIRIVQDCAAMSAIAEFLFISLSYSNPNIINTNVTKSSTLDNSDIAVWMFETLNNVA